VINRNDHVSAKHITIFAKQKLSQDNLKNASTEDINRAGANRYNNFVLHYLQRAYGSVMSVLTFFLTKILSGINQKNCVKIMFVEKNFIFDLVYL
jgi:hypothetical protein